MGLPMDFTSNFIATRDTVILDIANLAFPEVGISSAWFLLKTLSGLYHTLNET